MTDGQTERANRTIEDILRNYINFKQDDWDTWLPYVEIAINNSAATSTGKSPYFANYQFHPHFQSIQTSHDSVAPAALEFNNELSEIIKEIKIRLHAAQQRQSEYANRKRTEIEYSVGDEVWLSTKNLPVQTGSRKFMDKFIGPYKVVSKISHVAYKLELPNHFKIHPVFHISQLSGYRPAGCTFSQEESRPPPVLKGDTADADEWEIDQILDHRRRNRRLEFLVHWKGYGNEDNTWITESGLSNARALVDEYLQSHQLNINALQNRVGQSQDRIVETLRCEAITQKGVPCKLRTKRGNMCWFHLALNFNLRIKPSQLPTAGLGVYADKQPFQRGQNIIEYTGKKQPINGNDYALLTNRNTVINAARSRNVASFINDCRAANRREGQCTGNNTRFVLNRRAQKVNVRAVKFINPKSEIFIPYGTQYWRDKAKSEKFLLRQQRNAETKRILHLY